VIIRKKKAGRRAEAGITTQVCNHTFRASASPPTSRTTARWRRHGRWGRMRRPAPRSFMDRREDRVTLDEAVRITTSWVRSPLPSTRKKHAEKPTKSLRRGNRQLCAMSDLSGHKNFATMAGVAGPVHRYPWSVRNPGQSYAAMGHGAPG